MITHILDPTHLSISSRGSSWLAMLLAFFMFQTRLGLLLCGRDLPDRVARNKVHVWYYYTNDY